MKGHNNTYQTCRKFPFGKIQHRQITVLETLAIYLELRDSFQTVPHGNADK